MSHVLAYADEWADEARRTESADYAAAVAAVQARARANHPTYFGIITAVVYNDKSDRYIVKFGEGSSVKAMDEAAEFLLTHAFGHGMRPTVYGHMASGVLDGVLLLFLSRGTL
jgi:hypothetical protein